MTTNLRQVIETVVAEKLSQTYTNLPAEIISYDATTQTATVQPLLRVKESDGWEEREPPIEGVPVMFPSAGGGIISFPVQRGDTVLLCFSMRSIDAWMGSEGKAITPVEQRLHNLSDAIAIPGLYPKKNSLKPSAEDVEIKYKNSKVVLKKNGDVVIEGGKIELGEGATEGVSLGTSLKGWLDTHTHPAPSGATSAPTTPSPSPSTQVFVK